jgi:cellulose synthase (UDP-forming)
LLFFPIDWLVQTPARLFGVLVPILFLWTGLAPLEHADLADLINYQVPVIIVLVGLMTWLSIGRHLPFLSAGYSLLLSFRVVPTIVATLVKPFGTPFRVTPKGKQAGQGVDRFARGCALFLVIMNIVGLLINARAETRVIANPNHVAAAFFFSSLNIVLLLLVILAVRDRQRAAEPPAADAHGRIPRRPDSFRASAARDAPSLRRLITGLIARCLE